MGIVERQLPLCVHRSARCARPLKLEYDVQGVDDTLEDVSEMFAEWSDVVGTHRNVTQNGQQDVDEEISVAAALEEDTQRWEDDGEEDLADVAGRLLAATSKTGDQRCRRTLR